MRSAYAQRDAREPALHHSEINSTTENKQHTDTRTQSDIILILFCALEALLDLI